MTKQETRRSALGGQSRVQEIMRRGLEEQEATLSDGRGRPGNAGELGRDKDGLAKMTLALPVTIQAMIREMADAEEVSRSDIAEAAAVAFYNAWQAGQVDLSAFKRPARSLRVVWVLEIPADFSIATASRL